MAIQDNNWLYSLLRYYVDYTFEMAYSDVEYYGTENIPRDGAVIFAPNHTNALMDALAVLIVDHKPTVFVARADIFKRPFFAKLLTFFKIMPIMRMRDGRDNLKKNDDIMEKAVEVLKSGVPFCIMAEGTHRMRHGLLPLVKGIFRIALMADRQIAGAMPVYIVPMGIEYGSYVRFGSSLFLQTGEPINVTDFVREHSGMEQPELIMALRAELSERMKSLIFCVDDDENYDAVVDLAYLRNRSVQRDMGFKNNSPRERMLANRRTVEDVERWKREQPEEWTKLLSAAREFAALRREHKISDETLYDKARWGRVMKRCFMMIVSLLYFLYAAIVTAPVTVLSEIMCSRLEDKAFCNSFRYVIVLVLSPIVWILLAVLYAQWLPWFGVISALVLTFPAHVFVHIYAKWFRLVKSSVRFLRNGRLRSLLSDIDGCLSKLR